MGVKVRSWWQIWMVVGIILVGVIAVRYWLRWDWTGFQSKSLWDWLSLLVVPVVVAWGAVWLSSQQGKVNDAENKDNQRDIALREYIGRMSDLLLDRKLREPTEGDNLPTIPKVLPLPFL